MPGEHDMLSDNGEQYLQRYGKGTRGAGWHSFDHKGVHFVGLVNVVNLKAGGLGSLGHEQLEWLEDDLKGRSASTPIVLFAPHSAVDGLRSGAGARTMGRGSDVLEALWVGDGAERAHSPGGAEGGGQRDVSYCDVDCISAARAGIRAAGWTDEGSCRAVAARVGDHRCERPGRRKSLAIVDSPLGASASSASRNAASPEAAPIVAAGAAASSGLEVKIDNFAFTPGATTVKPGTQVTWINRDDIIRNTVDSAQGKFKSAALDTNDKFQFRFTEPGEYSYFCRMHPKMTGSVIVRA